MSDNIFQKFHYNSIEIERLKEALKSDLLLAEKTYATPSEIPLGYGYTTLFNINTPKLLAKVKAAAPNLNKIIESKINLGEYFFGKKIEDFKLIRIFSNILLTGGVIEKHHHGSFDKDAFLIMIYYLYSESDSGNLILSNKNEDFIISLGSGDLIVHPGYIPHSVSLYKGNIPRLSLIYEYGLKFD